jgi:AmiR/NasT family two-component response regulator
MDNEHAIRLKVLIAAGVESRLEEVTRTVSRLGHDVVTDANLDRVAERTAEHRPDLAMVIVGESSEQALDFIGRIVKEASCPVIAILDVEDRAFINEAAKRGIFAYISEGGEDLEEMQSSIDIVLRRFSEYHNLEGAFARRAVTERAKGILMERHGIGEEEAFKLIRVQARQSSRKMVDVAESILSSYRLLPGAPRTGVADETPSAPGSAPPEESLT